MNTNQRQTLLYALHLGVTLCGALGLALVGQAQLQTAPPQLIPGILCLGGALWLLKTIRTRAAFGAANPKTLLAHGLFVASMGMMLISVYLHTHPPFQAERLMSPWILGIALFLVACTLLDQNSAAVRPLKLEWQRQDTVFLLFALTIAMLLRGVALGTVPQTMNGDEGQMAMEAIRIINGTKNDPFTTGWLSHPTFWFYLQAFSIQLFGDTVAGVRAVSAIIGSLTVGGAYVFGRLLFTRRIAVLGTMVLATYHFHIHFSRMALNNIADPFWGIFILSALVIAFRTNHASAWGTVGIGSGLALYFYPGARLFIPLVGVVLLIEAAFHWRHWRALAQRHVWRQLGLLAFGALIAGGPILNTFAANPEAFMARATVNSWSAEDRERTAAATDRSVFTVVVEQMKHAYLAFNTYPDNSPFYDRTRPLLWGLSAALFGLGLVLAVSQVRQRSWRIAVLWFVLAGAFGGVMLDTPPHSPRYVTLAPIVCFFIAGAIDLFIRPFDGLGAAIPAGSWRRRSLRVAGPLVATLLVLAAATTSLNGYFRDYIERETIGGINTHAAMALATHLQTVESGTQVWFVVPPRMFYHGFAMLDFLARDVQASDVLEPIASAQAVPPISSDHPTLYVFSPERLGEIEYVQQVYPNGRLISLTWMYHAEPLLFGYQVEPAR